MSADNGVYILRTKDNQIRVVHSKAINGIFSGSGKYIPKQVVRHFSGVPFTKNMDIANRIAKQINGNLQVCEYGIQHLPFYNKTWKKIMEEASE